jgi:glyoxylase-like metal-dependent hydrolase (beta-lactamase superfamily II)
MAVDITPIALGIDTCYVLKAEGVIAIDAGPRKKLPNFLFGLARASIAPEEVQLIVITHGHWDHISSAGDMKSATGAKLAMHEREVPWLERSLTPFPPGVTPWGRTLAFIARFTAPFLKVPPARVDLSLGDGGMSLSDYGIPGRVLHTPGHSSGSVSVLLDGGEAFVGDLAMNGFPLRRGPGLPILAEDADAVVASWRMLLEAGAKRVYPAHGKPFMTDVIREAISM